MDTSPTAIRKLRGPLSHGAFAEALGVSELSVRRWELPDDHPEARRPRRASRDAIQGYVTQRSQDDLGGPGTPWAVLIDGGRWAEARDVALSGGRSADQVRIVLGTVALLSHGDVDAACTATVAPASTPRGAALAAWLASWPDGRVLDPAACRAALALTAEDPTSHFLACLAVARAADHSGDGLGLHSTLATLPPDPGAPVPSCLADALRARAAHLAGRGEEARVRWRSVASRAKVLALAPTLAEARLGVLEGLLLDGAGPEALSRALERATEAVARLRHRPNPAEVILASLEAEVHLRASDIEASRAATERAEAAAESLRWRAPGAWPARLRLAMETGDPANTRTRFPLGDEPGAISLQAVSRWLGGDRASARTLAAAAAISRTSGVNPALELLASTLAATVDPGLGLPRATAALERHPASWVRARLAPAMAAHHQEQGREDEATWALRAALPVLETAGDGAATTSVGLALSVLEDRLVAATPVERLVAPVLRLARRSGGTDAVLACLIDEVCELLPHGTGVEVWERDSTGRHLLRTRRGTEPRAPTLDRTLQDGTGRTLRLVVGPLRRDDRAAVVVLVEVARLALRDQAGSTPRGRPMRIPGEAHPVLLLAEPGTDTLSIARSLHTDGPFVVMGLDPPPPTTTGGIRFVPEVGELDPEAALEVAALLLDVTGPRVVAATSLGLTALERTAPELHRGLAACAVPVPPLRERPRELLTLAAEVAASHGVRALEPEARAALLEHPWPGNESELRHAVAIAAAQAPAGGLLAARHLPWLATRYGSA